MDAAIKIFRDPYGVPHLQAPTERGAIYAQGYVQAIDRLPSVYYGLRLAAGRLAEAYGQDYAELDAAQKLYALSGDLSFLAEEDQALLAVFVDGLKAGITASAENWGPAVMRSHIEPEAALVLKLAQAVTFPFVMDQVWQALDIPPPTPPLPLASNAWALAPQRSHDGSTLFCTDPHVLYSKEWLLHELGLYGGQLQAYGFQHPGTPYLHFGHNRAVAWGFTSGGAKVTAVEEISATAAATHSGRIFKHDGHYYHIVTSYDGQPFDHITPLRALALAQHMDDVKAVIAQRQLGPWNMLAADRDGHIHYSIVGRVPSGDLLRGETALYPAADLPQLSDPPSGYLMHSNCSPWNVSDTGLSREDYPPHTLYSSPPTSADGNNPRGRDLQKRLTATEKHRLEDAQAIAMSIDLAEADAVRLLFIGWVATYSGSQRCINFMNALFSWPRTANHPTSALLMEFYLELYNHGIDLEPLAAEFLTHGSFNQDLAPVIAAFDETLATYENALASRALPASAMLHIRRGDLSLPVVGAPNFCQRIVCSILGDEAEDMPGSPLLADYGQVCPLVVQFGAEGVRSFAIVPYGQSDDPASPHFNDQMISFAKAEFRETFFAKTLPIDTMIKLSMSS